MENKADKDWQDRFLSNLDSDLSPELALAFSQHAQFVLQHNQNLNLTRIVEAQDMAARHYNCAWKLAQVIPTNAQRIADFGSGAGFPGIPLAMLLTQKQFFLLEAREKKVEFLQKTVEHLQLKNVVVQWSRGEEFLQKQTVDTVVSQAVAPIRKHLVLLQKVRRNFAQLILMKGEQWQSEINASGEKQLGFQRNAVIPYQVKGLAQKRFFIVYKPIG